MQYCKGTQFLNRIEKDMSFHIDIMKKNNQYFSENLVINWVLQLVLGVQFIHSKKILHRDLKPQNIFIDNDMNIKIGDFGISKILATTS
jgi:NIMA (never in mitosis gene a)-related kinase 1/4/5